MVGSKEIHFGGARFSVSYLAMILREINESGGVNVRGIAPGSVNMLEIGATLAEMARQNCSTTESGPKALEKEEDLASNSTEATQRSR